MSFIYKADLRRRRTGETTAGVQRRRLPLRLDAQRQAILAYVAQHSDATMAELRDWLATEHGVRVCLATVWKTLGRFGLTFKKNLFGRPSRIGPTSPRHATPGAPPSPA